MIRIKPLFSFFILFISVWAQADPCDTSIPMGSCLGVGCQFRYTETVTVSFNLIRIPMTIEFPNSCIPPLTISKLPINRASELDRPTGASLSGSEIDALLPSIPRISTLGMGVTFSYAYTRYSVGSALSCIHTDPVAGALSVMPSASLSTYRTNRPLPPATCSEPSNITTGICSVSGTFSTPPFNFRNCNEGCTGPDGRVFLDGGSGVYYTSATAADCTNAAVRKTRVCSNGILSEPTATEAMCSNSGLACGTQQELQTFYSGPPITDGYGYYWCNYFDQGLPCTFTNPTNPTEICSGLKSIVPDDSVGWSCGATGSLTDCSCQGSVYCQGY